MDDKILYCNVGSMNYYQGLDNDTLTGGGSYNKDNIGSEIFNFLNCNGMYYGFVEPGTNKKTGKPNRIHLESFGVKKSDECASGILVIWVANRRIVGWYKNATVYANKQLLPEEILRLRNTSEHTEYNVISDDGVLIPPASRIFQINGMGECQHWFGNAETNKSVIEYIRKFEIDHNAIVNEIEDVSTLKGEDVLALVKQRVNQSDFRSKLLRRYHTCCVCGVDLKECLIASHIKPWRDSTPEEKTDVNNGLLLCPNHDKLFDLGYISFDENGKILISDLLDANNRMWLNAIGTMKIQITDRNNFYLAYHREHIFKA